MSDLAKIPVTIITGFLGAGKTTLIRHLMQNPQGKRLAVLVNEFGTVGVDGDILKSCADDNCPVENIVELANGCICCTVAEDFIPTIEALLALPKRPDHILIETSGLALPKPLLKAFDWPGIRSLIPVDGVITLADAEAALQTAAKAAGLKGSELAQFMAQTRHESWDFGKMKEVGTTSWNSPNTDATNTSLFSALPGGNRYNDADYGRIGLYGYWWSSSEYGANYAWFYYLYYYNSNLGKVNFAKSYGFSVRCLMD